MSGPTEKTLAAFAAAVEALGVDVSVRYNSRLESPWRATIITSAGELIVDVNARSMYWAVRSAVTEVHALAAFDVELLRDRLDLTMSLVDVCVEALAPAESEAA